MNGWIKHYSNGNNLVGSDPDVEQGLVSWSQSQLSDMIACELHHDSFIIKITGAGDYWQSDDFVIDLSSGDSGSGTLIKRRIQKQVGPQDFQARLIQHEVNNNVELVTYTEPQVDINGIIELDVLQNKWLTLEIDLVDQTTRIKILDSQV